MLAHRGRGNPLRPFSVLTRAPVQSPALRLDTASVWRVCEVNEDRACSTFYPFRPGADHQKLFARKACCPTL